MSKIIFVFFLFYFHSLNAQEIPFSSLKDQKNNFQENKAKKTNTQIPQLSSSFIKPALYSAILPGLGQLYNKKYWKASLVIGAITGGVIWSFYQKKIYKNNHNDYVNVVKGLKPNNINRANLDINQIYQIESNSKRYYNYVVLVTLIAYVINIMDGFVDAHLDEIQKDKQLSLHPSITSGLNQREKLSFGITLNFKF